MKHNWQLKPDDTIRCTNCGAYHDTECETCPQTLSRATRDAFEARTDRDLRDEPRTIDDFDATELQDSDSYKEFERKQSD